jgi:hypothetical protein
MPHCPQEQLVAAVKEEAAAHYAALLEQLNTINAQGPADAAAPEAAANVLVHNRSLLRNKRLLLAYVCVPRAPLAALRSPAICQSVCACAHAQSSNARMGRIKALRWSVGAALPAELSAALSPSETEFFQTYSR